MDKKPMHAPIHLIRYISTIGILLLLAGCNFPIATARSVIQPSRTPATQVDGISPVTSGSETETVAAPVPAGTETPMRTSTSTATIAHFSVPGNPGALEWYVTDYSSKSTAAEKRAPGGDSFPYNLFERPFLAEGMRYLPGVDIIRAEIARDTNWFYVTVYLQEAPTQEEKTLAQYGVEVDVDIDGRGDFLIWTSAPSGIEWTTDGVQIWEDMNGDVGGPVPVRSDAPGTRDGYEELTFDQGIGADPDAAWARFSAPNSKQVQIAFKRTAIGNDPAFLWAAWADAGVKLPGWFDYDDHFTAAEAGSSLAGKAEYPLKALAAVDNTCRMAYGFTLLGTEPGACYIPVPTATPTVTATATSGGVTLVAPPKTPLVPMIPFKVTAVTVTPEADTYSGTCPLTVRFIGSITTNGAGTVQYQWEPSIIPGSMVFTAAGTQTLSVELRVVGITHGSGVVKMRIHILSPNDMTSNYPETTLTCT